VNWRSLWCRLWHFEHFTRSTIYHAGDTVVDRGRCKKCRREFDW
jgi:hypothetical protein